MTFKRGLEIGSVVVISAAVCFPALAADWSERIEMCVDAVETEENFDLGDYDARFDGGGDRRFTIELVNRDTGASLFAECRVSRGRIASVELEN